MKGAKGGKRDRVISFLFSKKNSEIKEEMELSELEEKKNESSKNTYTSSNNIEEREEVHKVNTIDVNPLPMSTNENIIDSRKTIEQNKKDEDVEINIINEPIVKKDIEVDNLIPDVKVEEKVEILDDPFEEKIIEAFEKIIKDDLYELEEIKYELDVLSKDEDNSFETKEVEELKEKLEVLISKFEKIKDKYYNAHDNNILDIDDAYIYDLLLQYKEEIKDSDVMNDLEKEISKAEEYISIMDQIINVEASTDEMNDKLDDKLDEFEIRDEEFEKMKDEYQDIEAIKNMVEEFNYEQESIFNDLQKKVDESEKITKKVETDTHLVTNLNKLIEAALLISMSKKIPPTPRGNLIKLGIITASMKTASQFITTKETRREITTINFKDYCGSISRSIIDINTVTGKIDDSLIDIKNIKSRFAKECEEYRGQVKEFDELFNNINNIENELEQKRRIAIRYSNDFKKLLNKNNVKVKRLESENGKVTPVS